MIYFNLGLAHLELEQLEEANEAFKAYKSLIPEEVQPDRQYHSTVIVQSNMTVTIG